MRLFSNRYLQAIYKKQLVVVMPARLRKRIWMLMDHNNPSFGIRKDPADDWVTQTSAVEETMESLRLATGEEKPIARNDRGERVPVEDLQSFLQGCYPSQVLDAVEAFWSHLEGYKSMQQSFQDKINQTFEDESCPWRLEEGEFFKIDESFLSMRLPELAEQGLRSSGFRGSHNEFREARNDLLAGDTKGCISNAQKAFESALKTILGTGSGNASNLIRQLIASGRVDDLPVDFRKSFGEQVLMSVATMGNRLGRHGQGDAIVEVPSAYARLTLEMAAAYLNFLVGLRIVNQPDGTGTEITDEDIPF